MKIYWMFLIASLLLCVWCANYYQVEKVNNHYETKAYWIQGIFFFSVIIFFCGLRSGIADTVTYIEMFNDYPCSVSQIVWTDDMKDKGFYFLSVLYKQLISTDFHGWLFLITAISGIATLVALKKYSASFGLSCFLFIATTMFVYLVNGMRQYICVAIIFACTAWITERKFWRFLIIVLLLSTIHASALVMIPVYFLRYVKPWSGWMFLIIIVASIVAFRFDSILPFLGNLIEDTQYAGYISYISDQGVGSNVIRLMIAMIPCVLAFVGRRFIEEEASDTIRFSINMSVLNVCLYLIATFSSGMVIGRLTVYFDIYNIILLPWLLKYIFSKNSSSIVTILCMICYVAYFYYQMVVTWNLNYVSDVLNLYFWGR